MSLYSNSGQTQGKKLPQYIESGKIVSFPFTHEKDSRDKRITITM